MISGKVPNFLLLSNCVPSSFDDIVSFRRFYFPHPLCYLTFYVFKMYVLLYRLVEEAFRAATSIMDISDEETDLKTYLAPWETNS